MECSAEYFGAQDILLLITFQHFNMYPVCCPINNYAIRRNIFSSEN